MLLTHDNAVFTNLAFGGAIPAPWDVPPAGAPSMDGVIPKAMGQMFELAQEQAAHATFEFHVTVLEVYNEYVRDLISEQPWEKHEVTEVSGQTGVATVRNFDSIMTHLCPGLRTCQLYIRTHPIRGGMRYFVPMLGQGYAPASYISAHTPSAVVCATSCPCWARVTHLPAIYPHTPHPPWYALLRAHAHIGC